MTDIVWLLRNDCPCNGDIGCAQELCNQAADEIERLRQVLHNTQQARVLQGKAIIDAINEIERLKDGEARLRAALEEVKALVFGANHSETRYPLARAALGGREEIPDSSAIVSQIIPAGWNGALYSVASEIKRLLTSASDHGTNIDSGTMDGLAYLSVCIDGAEYFITVEESSGRSKNNPLATQEERT